MSRPAAIASSTARGDTRAAAQQASIPQRRVAAANSTSTGFGGGAVRLHLGMAARGQAQKMRRSLQDDPACHELEAESHAQFSLEIEMKPRIHI